MDYNRLNSGKPQTGNAVGNPERSPEGNVQRLSDCGVGTSVPKQAASHVDEDIVRSLPKGKAVYYCTNCHQPKIVPDDFYGINRVCKYCMKVKSLAYQKTDVGREAHNNANKKYGKTKAGRQGKKDYKTTVKGKEAERRYYKSKMLRTPEKTRARALINTHVRRKKIRKPLNCEDCGLRFPLEAHHKDYSKPLDVEWLCHRCHNKRV